MKLTFKEFKDYHFGENKLYVDFTSQEFEKFQSDCLIAEFMGYTERHGLVLKFWEEEYESWNTQVFEHGLFTIRECPQGYIYETDAHLIYDQMDWNCDWKQIMLVLDKIENMEHPIYKGRQLRVMIGSEECSIDCGINTVGATGTFMFLITPERNKIQSVYEMVVEFVKWINARSSD